MNENHKSESPFQGESWRPYLPVILAVCVGTILSLVAFLIVRTLEQQRIAVELELAAEEQVSALNRNLERNLNELESVAAFYAASNQVDRDEFQQFVQPFLGGNSSIQALEWIPNVPEEEREGYEQAAQEEGLSAFQFTERNSEGEIEPAASRDSYFPVYFVEPYEGNEAALGFDLGSNLTRLEALNLARDSGEAVATGRITLVEEGGDHSAFLVFQPIYKNGTATDSLEDRQKNLAGFALGVYRIGDILEDVLPDLDEELDVYLVDQSAAEDERFLYHYHVDGKDASHEHEMEEATLRAGLHHESTLDVAGREWLAISIPTAEYIGASRTSQPWGVLLAGLLFTGVLGAYFLNRIERTAELEATNDALEQEINERKQAEDALRKAQEQLVENNRILEERRKELSQANQEITDLSKRIKVEALRLGAELEVTRQQRAQQDLVDPMKIERAQTAPQPKVRPVTDRNPYELGIDEVTRQLQQILLPTPVEMRQIKGLDIAGYSLNQTSQDNYDLLLQHRQIQVGIGRGNILMLMTSSVVRTLLTSDESEHTHFVGQLNRTISDKAPANKPLSLALLNYRVNGGPNLTRPQEQMIVVLPGREVTVVDSHTLGFSQTNGNLNDAVQFQPVDGVVLYRNEDEEHYGLDPLREVITRHWEKNASDIIQAVIADIEEQIGEPTSDFSLLVLKQN
ncbi:MAG: CHASE domain-containing protein [Ardenticatenaceae bacterium]